MHSFRGRNTRIMAEGRQIVSEAVALLLRNDPDETTVTIPLRDEDSDSMLALALQQNAHVTRKWGPRANAASHTVVVAIFCHSRRPTNQ